MNVASSRSLTTLIAALLLVAVAALPMLLTQVSADSPAPPPGLKSDTTHHTAELRWDDTSTNKPTGNPQDECPDPTPTAVEVEDVPIVVRSTTQDYFVLYVTHELDEDSTVELPVLVKRGEAGTTTLVENAPAPPKERYRIEKYLLAEPADVDGDCIDDITELDNLGSMNPVNPAGSIELTDGTVAIPDQETLDALSYNEYYLKFILTGINTGDMRVYFINTNTHVEHASFLRKLGINRHSNDIITGIIQYNRNVEAPDGSRGLYSYHFQRLAPFSLVARSYSALTAGMPVLEGNLAFYLRNSDLLFIQHDMPSYGASRINILFEQEIVDGSRFKALNTGEGYGLLRFMTPDDRPNPRDVVIYDVLPNSLPRVAGIITTVPQTPLSHVNLRAVQEGIPNAYVRGATQENLTAVIGRYVRYTVTEKAWDVRVATQQEVNDHYELSRPPTSQIPERDLSIRTITALSDIGFEDWDAFGVKAANVAVLGQLNLPEGTIPQGFAIPFHFYDEFMKHNDLYTRIETMLADPDFQNNYDEQESELKKLRKAIKKAETPQWIVDAIVKMNESFDEGVNRRYRSSTNNEDLPGFNGAGLYDSKSQKPSEDEDDLAKSLKEVYASLWNFRAFVERDFHRIDHLAAAMGVLVHPSYQDETVNGVAVSFDPVLGREGWYYVNSQVGEDLVTNPNPLSAPEEGLLSPHYNHTGYSYEILSTSNQVPPGNLLLTADQLIQLRDNLQTIHDHFEKLYEPGTDEPFAMEIEFKITSENILAIKQARPWVFNPAPASDVAGIVTLSPTQPQVAVPMTASLSDPNGRVSNLTWSWAYSTSGTSSWTPFSGSRGATYTPSEADVGYYLQVTASYTDALEVWPGTPILPNPPFS